VPQADVPSSGYDLASNGSTLAGGWDAAVGATLAGGVVPVHAAMIAAQLSSAAIRSGRLDERVMRWYSSSCGPSRRLVTSLPADAGRWR